MEHKKCNFVNMLTKYLNNFFLISPKVRMHNYLKLILLAYKCISLHTKKS